MIEPDFGTNPEKTLEETQSYWEENYLTGGWPGKYKSAKLPCYWVGKAVWLPGNDGKC